MHVSRLLILGLVLGLAACSNNGLRSNVSSGEGPDEFSIIPGKTLAQPKDYAALPAPTPGDVNRTDLDPIGDAMVALGGKAQPRANTGEIGRNDGALVNYASRQGRTADVRQATAAEDAEFRKKRGRFTGIRFSKKGLYEKVYEPQQVDSYETWWLWRRAGARTPAAPNVDG